MKYNHHHTFESLLVVVPIIIIIGNKEFLPVYAGWYAKNVNNDSWCSVKGCRQSCTCVYVCMRDMWSRNKFKLQTIKFNEHCISFVVGGGWDSVNVNEI